MIRVGRTYINAPFVRSNRLRDTLEIECWHHVDLHMDDSHAVARALNNDLHGQIGDLVAVHSNGSARLDGFYVLRMAEVETINQAGRFSCFLTLDYVGSSSDVLFESRLIGTVKTNDFSYTEALSEPMHAPPPHTNYDPRHTTTITRSVAYEYPLSVYRDVPFTVDPKWGVEASDFYIGAVTVQRRDPLYPELGPIGGTQLFIEELEDVELSNGIARWHMFDHKPVIEFWDGADWRGYTLAFNKGGVPFTEWDRVSIAFNSPELCVLRYLGGINGRLGATISMRRGERGVTCVLDSDESTTLGVFEVTPSNMNVSQPHMIHSSASAEGHKLMYVSSRSFNTTPAEASIYKTGTKRFDVGIMAQLSGAGAGNLAAQLEAQYFAALSEDIRAVKR